MVFPFKPPFSYGFPQECSDVHALGPRLISGLEPAPARQATARKWRTETGRLGFYWDFIGILLRFYWDFIGIL